MHPSVWVDYPSIAVNELQTATNKGPYRTFLSHQCGVYYVGISASIGTITKTGGFEVEGYWTRSFATADVSADQTQTVTITARDNNGRFRQTSFSLTVRDTGRFGPGNWPGPGWRPYADSSCFNQPIRPNPVIAENSDAIVSRFTGKLDLADPTEGMARDDRPNNFVVHTDGSYGGILNSRFA